MQRKKIKAKPHKKNRNKTVPSISDTSQSRAKLYRLAQYKWMALFLLLSLSSLILYTLPLRENFNKANTILRWSIVVLVLLIMVPHAYRMFLYKYFAYKTTYDRLRMAKMSLILYSVYCGFYFAFVLVNLGIVEKSQSMILSTFPFIKEWVAKTISWLGTAIASGVIGNLAYDLLKRIFKLKRKV